MLSAKQRGLIHENATLKAENERLKKALAERAGEVKVEAQLQAALAVVEYQPGDHPVVPIKHDQFVKDIRRILSCITTEPAAPEGRQEVVASIVPEHCSGSSLVFSEGVLHVNKDGSGHIVVKEADFQIETEYDDDGARSDFWITRFPPGEMQSLKDFLNGMPFTSPAEQAGTDHRKIDGAIRGLERIKSDFKMRGSNATTIERAIQALRAAALAQKEEGR